MRRRHLTLRLAASAAFGLLVALAPATAGPAAADHTPVPDRVTLMGSLMSELGCAADWDESCDRTDLLQTSPGASTFANTFAVPAGSYEVKVRLDGSWTENYGADGVAAGPNIPLVLLEPASLRFTYDHASHRLAIAPAKDQPGLVPSDRALARTSLRKDLTRERFYFVMADRFANGSTANDTGGLTGGRLQSGFDPTDKAFYHGGDLQGLTAKLDYIKGLGTTAIWMTPSFKNKPVQGEPGKESAGYHGYWVTDFTKIDPHLGTNADLKTLVDSAHAKGMKVFFDIITNHTADVLDYPDSAYAENGTVPYKSKAQAPYVDTSGTPFDDRDYASGDTFPPVDESSFPYRPTFRSPADETAKTPAWLNDPTMYHNRGTSTFTGEDSEYGDFPAGTHAALDDLWTERPEVVHGMEDIYKAWVRDAGVDGFRIDTVKHVNMAFWQRFAPEVKGYAAALGNKDFFMFGEVFDADPRFMSQYTTTGRLQATVDFGFQANATNFAKGKPTTGLRDFFAAGDWFTDADSNAYSLPTFLGNHDMGRIGKFLSDTGATGEQLLERDELAHSLMYVTRGQPVVYYGDEQGFTGDGGDQDARQDMFASKVATYNDDDLIGTDATTAQDNYQPGHPLYRHLAALSALRDAYPALADGAQVHRFASDGPGIYAFSRIRAGENREFVVAANNADTASTATFPTYAEGQTLRRVWPTAGGGTQQITSDGEGRVTVTVPARSLVVYRATARLAEDDVAPAPFFKSPGAGGVVSGRAEVGVGLPGNDFDQVSVAWRPVGGTRWTLLGTDDNAPYRVFHDVRSMAKGTLLEYRAVVRDHDGDLGVASTYGVVGDPPPAGGGGGGVGPVTQPQAVSIPGSHGSEIGCPDSSTDGGSDPGDWDPTCPQAQLALDADDDIWKTTVSPAAGGYAFKAAIDKSWDENYGAGALRNGGDIGYTTDGAPVSFYYDHRTHWVTNDRVSKIVTAAGSFQSEMGCPGDWLPDCMRGWLQDPDGDGVYSLATTEVPAGSYEWKATVGLSWNENYGEGGTAGGSNIAFTVPANGYVTTFSWDSATHVPSVTSRPGQQETGPDLSTSRATWVQPDLVAWDLPADTRGWTYRLYWGESLTLDAETVSGGQSVPLTLLAEDQLQLSPQDASRLRDVYDSRGEGLQLAVAAFDDLGRIADATGVTFPSG
ncbi:MAG TPA: alpha-amylase family glycosyl hydrolase [Actinomycetes bacterium]